MLMAYYILRYFCRFAWLEQSAASECLSIEHFLRRVYSLYQTLKGKFADPTQA